MKLSYIAAIISLGLLSGCAFFQGLKDKPASAPKQQKSAQETEALSNKLANVQSKASNTAAKTISPVTQ